jgi:hypothetical protein
MSARSVSDHAPAGWDTPLKNKTVGTCLAHDLDFVLT